MQFYNNLPNSLTKEEQNKLLTEYKMNGNLVAREKLIIHNLKLISFIINKKFENSTYDYTDLFSIGIIGLIKSIDTFDIEKNFSFSTYSIKCIYNYMINNINTQNKINKNEISLETPINIDQNEDNLIINDIIYDLNSNIEEIYDEKEQRLFIEEMLSNLNEKERRIITLRFGLNGNRPLEVIEIAKIFNISRQYMYILIDEILIKIKSNMATYYKVNRSKRRQALKEYYKPNSKNKFDF